MQAENASRDNHQMLQSICCDLHAIKTIDGFPKIFQIKKKKY